MGSLQVEIEFTNNEVVNCDVGISDYQLLLSLLQPNVARSAWSELNVPSSKGSTHFGVAVSLKVLVMAAVSSDWWMMGDLL